MAASGTTKNITTNQILGSGGTATLASATISGDLTVDTSTLKVDSTNNRVGIGTATPAAGYALDVRGILAAGNSAGTIIGGISFSTRPEIGAISNHNLGLIANNSTMHLITPAGVFDWYDGAGGTRMTLDATGLGVGVSPTNKLNLATSSGSCIAGMTNGTNSVQYAVDSTGPYIYSVTTGAQSLRILAPTGSTVFTVDGTGNVGVGVTPNAAWNVGSGKTIQLTANASLSGGLTNSTYLAQNWYYDNTNSRYLAVGYALVYEQNKSNGNHVWYNTTLGAAAGDVATIIPAMTLDINGNLILRSSATPATLATNGQLTVNATSNTNLRFSYRGSDGTTRVANITLA
jgi:hypothetical protein